MTAPPVLSARPRGGSRALRRWAAAAWIVLLTGLTSACRQPAAAAEDPVAGTVVAAVDEAVGAQERTGQPAGAVAGEARADIADPLPPTGDASAASVPSSREAVDRTGFRTVTRAPLRVPGQTFLLCHLPPQVLERGLHFMPLVTVEANPLAADALADGATVMPVGSVVSKLKHTGRADGEALVAVASMIKREAGYDPGRGDWEYVYEDLEDGGVGRGRLASCIECHDNARSGDHLFRRYTPEQVAGVER